ncbi:MAG TPA: contact-dependent growth inhibition system immunity protein [Gemmatimonadaceae bacterium]|nr:contact-dependent growth inhibition system immunity protein [Gemmatimonadaceae bacterium]
MTRNNTRDLLQTSTYAKPKNDSRLFVAVPPRLHAAYLLLGATVKLSEITPRIAVKPDFDSSTTHRAWSLRDKRVSELSPADLAFCLRQNIAAQQVAERALAMVADQPLLQAEFYPGDVIAALIQAAEAGGLTAAQRGELRDVCSAAVAAFHHLQKSVIPAAESFVERYDGGA